MNTFVDYLNSTNNFGGNSTGSLAEKQVSSNYFDKVKVDRKLGTLIADTVTNAQYQAFILTGHAGDGKTSILVQVLKSLGLLHAGEGLKESDSFEHLYYVKDMSEIKAMRQSDILRTALNAPANGQTSLLITNTGPLLNAFLQLAEEQHAADGTTFSEQDRIQLQSALLTQLDKNADHEITIAGYRFILVNIARVDNVAFAESILERIVEPSLWTPCQNCKHCASCPIYWNATHVQKYFASVSNFISSVYRFLYENDRRMTIRQMVGQLSYALTGNLTCAYVKTHYLKNPFFTYNFANLFFGYAGLEEVSDSTQLRGIHQMRLLALDKIALDADYHLFVKNIFTDFPTDVADVLQSARQTYSKHYHTFDEDQAHRATEQRTDTKLRRAIRRFFLMYSLVQDRAQLYKQVFGAYFTQYEKIITATPKKSDLHRIQDLLFRALYIKNTGFLPGVKENSLPLTLRRDDNIFQNVMLVLGSVPKNNLECDVRLVQSRFEDMSSKNELVVKVKGEAFTITLPMLTFFDLLVQGAIASNNDPALTHGIARLDTLLLEKFGDTLPADNEDCELTVLVNTTNGQEFKQFSFENSELVIF